MGDLTLDEKATLTAGQDLWSTAPVGRVGIPSWGLTDGPNGARGKVLPGAAGTPAVCVPCGSALGATWDPGLVEEVAVLLGEETRAKGCRVLLAPTVNIVRSPLAGRNFECFSEDPLLSGRLAAAFVRGVQAQGVITTVKHFAGNEAETNRFTDDSIIGERALREIYMPPFEMAVRDGGALGVMTAYNRLNGRFCAEQADLIGILRDEWGFDGFVVTDWYAAGSTAASVSAGVDLEMPGPGRFFGPRLAAAVRAGEVDEAAVDAQVRRLLSAFERVGALGDVDDLGEHGDDRPEHRAVCRRAAADGTVLLRNEGVLPWDPAGVARLAVIGPNAARAQIMGGGSAAVNVHYRTTPLEAISAAFGAAEVVYARGADLPEARWWIGPLTVELSVAGEVRLRRTQPDSRVIFLGPPVPGVREFAFRATATITPAESGAHRLSLVQAGAARVLVDGVVVLDGVGLPPSKGTGLWGFGSEEVSATVELVAGRPAEVVIEFNSAGAELLTGVEVECRPPPSPDLLAAAVAAASAADAAVVVVGTTDTMEAEDHDRLDLRLPAGQDELISAVIAANPNTVIVVNAGAPVAMDWAADARCVLQSWFGGQEMAGALAEVLCGAAEPGGRLPVTVPVRVEHTPAFGNFPGEGGRTVYGEGVLVGYRWYEARHLPTRFPFGHGLSYTTFEIGPPELSATEIGAGDAVTLTVRITNTGTRPGTEVVQCYVAPLDRHVLRPPKELKGFAKVRLGPAEATAVTMTLDARAFAHWQPSYPDWASVRAQVKACNPEVRHALRDPAGPGWRIDPGRFEIQVGRSSADIAHRRTITVREEP
jgi:beta-glucosidase